jgi:hypothetical protein
LTSPKSSKLTWDTDGKTTQAPSQSQQRVKTAKPGLSWDEDASTVTAPASAALPAAAYRPADETTPLAASVDAGPAPQPEQPVPAAANEPANEPADEPAAPPRAGRRWLVLVIALPLFYALGYTAVRVTQKLQQDPSTQLKPALAQVLTETLDQVKRLSPGRASAGDDAAPQPASR